MTDSYDLEDDIVIQGVVKRNDVPRRYPARIKIVRKIILLSRFPTSFGNVCGHSTNFVAYSSLEKDWAPA